MAATMTDTRESLVIKVGSRKSQLALYQTNFVVGKLRQLHPEITFEIISMSTIGDEVLDRALSKIGEKSLFTKELEIALEQNLVDFVVHSLKDLPTNLPDGMAIAAILERDDPEDAVVFHPSCPQKYLHLLPEDSVIGTSSLRRVAQLRRKYPHLKFENIRGNLNTRLGKLDNAEQYSAIVLAKAGLVRMGWNKRIDQVLSPVDECMYAVSQGALGVECRADDNATIRLLSELNHTQTILRCVAERAFLKMLEGGCTVPIATHTVIEQKETSDQLTMAGGVFSLDGNEALTSSVSQTLVKQTDSSQTADYTEIYAGVIAITVEKVNLESAQVLGEELAQILFDQGAKPILDQAKEEHRTEQELLKVLQESSKPGMPNWPNIEVK